MSPWRGSLPGDEVIDAAAGRGSLVDCCGEHRGLWEVGFSGSVGRSVVGTCRFFGRLSIEEGSSNWLSGCVLDVWELFRVIIDQRKERELNPTLSMLRTAAEQVDAEDDTHPVTKERIHNMLEFVETTSGWYEQISDMPTSTLRKLMKLGRKITKLVS